MSTETVHGLAADEVLELADAGNAATNAAQRGLELFAGARPDLGPSELTAFTLGARDAWIAALGCATFGRELTGRVSCPSCSTLLAVSIEEQELGFELPPDERAASRQIDLELGELVVRARTPDGDIVLDAASAPDVPGARESLITSCVLEAVRSGVDVDPLTLSDDELAEVGDAILAADPQAEVRMELSCAQCGHSWSPVLDPALFFWQEISAATTQILDDVHQLAVGYGWSEDEVLRLSARRRRRYVERLLDG